MSENFLISLNNADVALSGKLVLHDIDWQVCKGQHWRVDGKNGAGKTTLLKTVAGLLWPVAKQPPSRLFGFNQSKTYLLSGIKQNIGYGSYGMQDEYVRGSRNISCYEVIASGFNQSIMLYDDLNSEQEKSIRKTVVGLKLQNVLGRSFLSISHGQKSAVLFARALIHQPKLLILDEIFNGVDQKRFQLMIELLQSYKAQGGQIILSWHEHGIEAIEKLFTHRLLMDQGRVIKSESTRVKSVSQHSPQPDLMTWDSLKTVGDKLLELNHIDVYLQNEHILKNINWCIRQHERWLLKGANGAGKTTLLKTLLAEIRPAIGGQIFRRGFNRHSSVWQVRKLIGYVSPELQQAYHYNISVFEAVASGFFSSIGLYDEIDESQHQRILQVLKQFALTHVSDYGVHQISSGQMRRVLIARAIVHNPEIMIFDEITANLDRQSRRSVLNQIASLISQNKTMIFVTHHENELSGYYNRVLTLTDGRAKIEQLNG